jgi:2-polyprenyl-3-methyl-5-hydroxy-6-metoxy-1,4-benzoquinol methylase
MKQYYFVLVVPQFSTAEHCLNSTDPLVVLARELCVQGQQVCIFSQYPENMVVQGVLYRYCADWSITWQHIDCDIFIVAPGYEYMQNNINSKLNLIWLKDIAFIEGKMRNSQLPVDLILSAAEYSHPQGAQKLLHKIEALFSVRAKDSAGVINRLIYESDICCALQLSQAAGLKKVAARLTAGLNFVADQALAKKIYEDSFDEALPLLEAHLYENMRFNWLAERVAFWKIKSFLDYACHQGQGALTVHLRNPQVAITGYDISERAIQRARHWSGQYAREARNIYFTAQGKELRPGAYDAIFFGEYLEHTLDPEAVVEQLERYVVPGGKIFMTLPRGPWEALSFEKNRALGYWFHVQSFDLRDILEMFGQKKDFAYSVGISGLGLYGEPLGNYLIEYTVDGTPTGKRDFARKMQMTRPLAAEFY